MFATDELSQFWWAGRLKAFGRTSGADGGGAPVPTLVHGTHDLGVHAKVKATSASRRIQKQDAVVRPVRPCGHGVGDGG
jgi:hypothetical protein